MKARQFYISVTRDERGKKQIDFGGTKWGDLKKSNCNARAVRTGSNLMVVDVDTKDLKSIDKKLMKLLPKTATVATAKGFHWYFSGADDVQQTQKLVEGVDIRNQGGFVFDKYWGKEKEISYKKTGSVYKMDMKLHEYLKKLHGKQSKRVGKIVYAIDGDYPEFEDGEQHEMIRLSMQEDFKKGLSYNQVYTKGQVYIKKYLKDVPHEQVLMQGRVDWAFKMFNGSGSSLDGTIVNVKPTKKVLTVDDQIKETLSAAAKLGALALENAKKEIKEDHNITMATLNDMVKETMTDDDQGINKYFDGAVIFEPAMGLFADVKRSHVSLYKASSFKQVLMGNSGWMTPSDVNEMLCKIPNKYILYKPDMREGEVKTDHGEDAVNVYRAPTFPDCKKKKLPKQIGMILTNLFLTQPEAREVFINWMAYIVQTGNRTGVAWGFFGASGSGKTAIATILGMVLGKNNCSFNVGDVALQSAFNPYLYNKQLVHLNEVASDFHGRHGVAGKLKAMVSDDYLQINQKGIGEIGADNYCNVILNSNKADPIELDPDDRRWNMVKSTRNIKSMKGFKKFKLTDVVPQFRNYLLNYDVNPKSATEIMALSDDKQSVANKTNTIGSQLAGYMVQGDFESIMEITSMGNEDINSKTLRDACDSKKWSNSLMLELYKKASGKDRVTFMDIQKQLLVYIPNKTSFRTKSERGWKVVTA